MRFSLRLFNSFIVRDLIRNWTHTIITVFGIALGVSMVLAINLASNCALAKFRESVDAVAGKANLEIRASTSAYVEQSTLKDIDWLTQLGCKYTPIIKASAMLNDNSKEFVQLLGIDMLADPDFTTYAVLKDTSKQEESNAGTFQSDPIGLLNEDPSHAVFVGERLANRHGLKQGGSLDLIVNDSLHHLVVTGILSGVGLGGAYSGDLILLDIDSAQALLGIANQINQIEVIVPEKDLLAVRERLVSKLPHNLSVATPEQHSRQIRKMTEAFEFNLHFLSFIALMVGMFLIYNTMTICVIRRRTEIGTLRVLGISRFRVMCLFALEALTYGVVGSCLGIVAGIYLGSWALRAVSQTVQYFYLQMNINELTLDWRLIAATFGIGTGLTVIASIPAILEASTVTPAEAVREFSYDIKAHRLAGLLALAGIFSLILAAAASVQPTVNDKPIYGYISVLLSMMGCVMLSSLMVKKVLCVMSEPFGKIIGAEGKIAVRALYGSLGRTVVAIASLMVGIAMVICLTIVISSFRITVESWLNQTFKADLWMEPLAEVKGSVTSRLSHTTINVLATIPQIVAVEPFIEQPIEYRGQPTLLAASDFRIKARYGHWHFTSGDSNSSVCSTMPENGAIVSENFAVRNGVRQGDELTIPTAQEPLQLKVKDVYYNYTTDRGCIVIPMDLFQKTFHDDSITSCGIYLKHGVNASAVRSEILQKLGLQVPVIIRTTSELCNESMKIFDRTFNVVYALQLIAMVVAVLAIMNSLFALILELRREFGILRYLGATRMQLRRIVMMQAGILGFLGNAWGLGLGVLLSLLLIYTVNRQSFGWTVGFSIPFDFMLQTTFLAICAALAAGIIPANLAAKTVAPEVVRGE